MGDGPEVDLRYAQTTIASMLQPYFKSVHLQIVVWVCTEFQPSVYPDGPTLFLTLPKATLFDQAFAPHRQTTSKSRRQNAVASSCHFFTTKSCTQYRISNLEFRDLAKIGTGGTGGTGGLSPAQKKFDSGERS